MTEDARYYIDLDTVEFEEAMEQTAAAVDREIEVWWQRDLPEFEREAERRGKQWLEERIADRHAQVVNWRQARLAEMERYLRAEYFGSEYVN